MAARNEERPVGVKLVVTRPQHDVTTTYLSCWAEEVVKLAREKGVEVVDLIRDKANKREFEGRVKKLDPELIFLNGHGCDDCVTGHDNQVLVKAENNHEILKGRITYSLSCSSAKVLGHKVGEDKRSSYIGYLDDFIFMCDKAYTSKPLNDPKAKPFMLSSNQVVISILKGHSVRDASTRSKTVFRDHFIKLASNETDPDSLQAAQFLWWNMRNQVCLGSEDAKLSRN